MQKRFKVIRLAQKMRRGKPSAHNRKQRENHQRHSHAARRFVNVHLALVKSRPAKKCEKYQPEHVEGGKPRASKSKQPKCDVSVGPGTGRVQNFVLTEKSGKTGNSRNRKRRNKHRPVSHWNLFSQPAHV